ncbi:MAG: Mth938-like domain-containing protein [Pseudomonadota bacterium]|nr:Mth938-like domain-containing protein [Pseudomonadota bacterium]MEE3025326.1 Mth938-like domain-containing protein [Pseudomonadota bacterium]
MVDIRTFGDGSDLQLIHGYGDGGFRVAGERHGGSLFLHTRQAQAWEPPQNLDQLTVDELMPLIGANVPPLLVLGTGAPPNHPFSDLGQAFREKGIALEVLSTPAACRTWNVLMSEGRIAAAALVAI